MADATVAALQRRVKDLEGRLAHLEDENELLRRALAGIGDVARRWAEPVEVGR